tara:strand:+ start:33296 stop:33541 length:246 start_codon:yes stop_codon:yes gene_type:complete
VGRLRIFGLVEGVRDKMNNQQLIYRLTKELYDLKQKLDEIYALATEINDYDEYTGVAFNARKIINLIDVTEDYSEILNDND